ncbi:MAG: hypothetical protein WCA27_30030 [Candidatus Sulfotelmatobacter sp.]
MAKEKSTTMTLHSRSTAAERETANRTHMQEVAGHLIDNAVSAGHGGHMLGRQGGAKGHEMPPSDAHLQSGQYLPQASFAKVPQNTSTSRSNEQNADNPASKDYGVADCGDTDGT